MASYLDLLLHPAAGTILGYISDTLHNIFSNDWGWGSSTPNWGTGSSTGNWGLGSSTPDMWSGSSTP